MKRIKKEDEFLMDNTLQQLCELQLKNEECIRNAKVMDAEEFVKLGALLCTLGGFNPDVEKIKACEELLKQKSKKAAEFHGLTRSMIMIKMSIAQDPESYIDGVISIYQKIIKGKIFSSSAYVITAMTIYDHCLIRNMDIDTVTDKTIEAWKIWDKGKLPAEEWDMPYVALMVINGRDFDNAMQEIMESYEILKKDRHLPAETAKATSILLLSSPKSTEEKTNNFCDLYEALKKQKCHTSSARGMSIYAMFLDLNEDRDDLINNIAEVSEFFKSKKGYGMFSGTDDIRKSLAASLVLQSCLTSVSEESAAIMSVLVTEEIIYLLFITYFMMFSSLISIL